MNNESKDNMKIYAVITVIAGLVLIFGGLLVFPP